MYIRQRIYANLKGRVHDVNKMVALDGLDLYEGSKELHKMVRDGLVEIRYFESFDFYKLSWRGREELETRGLKLVVDNTTPLV